MLAFQIWQPNCTGQELVISTAKRKQTSTEPDARACWTLLRSGSLGQQVCEICNLHTSIYMFCGHFPKMKYEVSAEMLTSDISVACYLGTTLGLVCMPSHISVTLYIKVPLNMSFKWISCWLISHTEQIAACILLQAYSQKMLVMITNNLVWRSEWIHNCLIKFPQLNMKHDYSFISQWQACYELPG